MILAGPDLGPERGEHLPASGLERAPLGHDRMQASPGPHSGIVWSFSVPDPWLALASECLLKGCLLHLPILPGPLLQVASLLQVLCEVLRVSLTSAAASSHT